MAERQHETGQFAFTAGKAVVACQKLIEKTKTDYQACAQTLMETMDSLQHLLYAAYDKRHMPEDDRAAVIHGMAGLIAAALRFMDAKEDAGLVVVSAMLSGQRTSISTVRKRLTEARMALYMYGRADNTVRSAPCFIMACLCLANVLCEMAKLANSYDGDETIILSSWEEARIILEDAVDAEET